MAVRSATITSTAIQAIMDVEESPEDGRVQKTLAPPQVREHGWMFGDSDSSTTTSFGHRPKSASRTFNPVAMKVEPMQPHRSSNTRLFMSTTVLYNLLHPPPTSSLAGPSASSSIASAASLKAAAKGASSHDAAVPSAEVATQEEGPEVTTPPNELILQESGWDNKFHVHRRKFFSDVTTLLSGANYSSVEKLTRFHKKSAGIDIPELYRNRYERDLEVMKHTSGTFFPRKEPQLIGKAPLTPRTLKCNQLIKRILKKEQETKEYLAEKVRRHQRLVELEKIPKLTPLRI